MGFNRHSEIPSARRGYINDVRYELSQLQCSDFYDDDAEGVVGAWVRKRFPNWADGDLFPFVLSKKEIVILNDDSDTSLMFWFSAPEILRMEDSYEDIEVLLGRGLLFVGYDTAGSYVCIDTGSASGWDVVVVDTAEFGCGNHTDSCMCFTRCDLRAFFQAIRQDPTCIDRILSNHYGGLPWNASEADDDSSM